MARSITLIFFLIPICPAYIWPALPMVQMKTVQDNFNHPTIVPSILKDDKDDHLTLLYARQSYLERSIRRPDCLRRVADEIHSRCHELNLDETGRINAAISMTLCELGTAHSSGIPLECSSFGPGSRQSTAVGTNEAGACVTALSRSAQHWSTYSGYFREVVQVCFALRQSIEQDLAKEVYMNITRDQIVYIQAITQRSSDTEVNLRMFDRNLMQLDQILIALRMGLDDFKISINETRFWIYTSMIEVLSESVQQIQSDQHFMSLQRIEEFDHSLGRLLHQTKDSLSESILASFTELDRGIGLITSSTSHHLSHLEDRISSVLIGSNLLANQLNQTLTTGELLSSSLLSAFEQASHNQDVLLQSHQYATASVRVLDSALQELINDTVSGLWMINTTSTSLIENLSINTWLSSSLSQVLLAQVPHKVIAMLEHPFGRILAQTLLVLCRGLQTLIATIIGLVVIRPLRSKDVPKDQALTRGEGHRGGGRRPQFSYISNRLCQRKEKMRLL